MQHRDCKMHTIWTPEFHLRNFRAFTENQIRTFQAVIEQFGDYNMLLTGPAGTGKTTLMSALFHRGLMEWARQVGDKQIIARSVWKGEAGIMAEQNRKMAMSEGSDDLGEPVKVEVDYRSVQTALRYSLTPRLFIDEFDKFKMASEFQENAFHRIIDQVSSNNGQVVAASNLDWRQIRTRMGDLQYGTPILRRIMGHPRGIWLDFEKRQAWVNLQRVYWDAQAKELKFSPTDRINDLVNFAGGSVQSEPSSDAPASESRTARVESRRESGGDSQTSTLPKGGTRKHNPHPTKRID